MFFNIAIIKNKIKSNYELLFAGFLWLMIWATYNTDITRVFSPKFPYDILDLLHGVRSFFPFIALIIAVIVLIKKNGFKVNLLKWPLGFLAIYTIVGIVASLFLSKTPLVAFYWGILYLSAVVVLWAILSGPNLKEKVSFILYVNFVIAGAISVFLMAVFLLHSGTFSLATMTQFLQGHRPYENINNIAADVVTFGMAGTRPTGLGRYAGLASIFIFANFWQPNRKLRVVFYLLFVVFFPILIFTRARTSIVVFLIAVFLIALYKARSKLDFIFILGSVLLLLWPMHFYQFSSAYLTGESLLQEKSLVIIEQSKPALPIDSVTSQNVVSNVTLDTKKEKPVLNNQISVPVKNEGNENNSLRAATLTLSGRTTGIWPESWGLFLRSPSIGFGFQADRIFLEGQHAHNSLLQALVQAGAIGTFFFLLAFLMSWFFALRLLKKLTQDVVLLGVVGALVYITLRGITESSAFFGADYLFLLPIIAYIQILYFNTITKA